jgi:N-acetylglucosamine kinase-like BadF-type ATPase
VALVLGIDGGQSSTRTVLANADGELLGACRTGPSNHIHEPGGLERQYAALHDGMLGAFAAAGIAPRRVDVACLGMTGSGHRPTVEAALDAERIVLLGDMDTGFAGAIPDGVGTVVIAGTGAIAQGRDAHGHVHRTGGWGYLAGDEGGGYDLGVRALRAVYRAFDGRGPGTRLTELLLEHYRAPDLRRLRASLYGPSTIRARIAASAEVVGRVAAAGDAVALALLRDAAAALADLVTGVLAALDPSAARAVAMIGGVANAGPPLLEPFAEAIHARHPHAIMAAARFDPARGALILALRELGGVCLGPDGLARLGRPLSYRDAHPNARDAGPTPLDARHTPLDARPTLLDAAPTPRDAAPTPTEE